LGADQSVPWEYHKNPIDVIDRLRSEGFRIVILEHTDQPKSYFETNFEFPLCLVVGHEIVGVSEKIVALADSAIEIPMFGVKQSLNVSVAYGIAIYEIVRQWSMNRDS